MRGGAGNHYPDFPLVNQDSFWSPSGTDGQLFSKHRRRMGALLSNKLLPATTAH